MPDDPKIEVPGAEGLLRESEARLANIVSSAMDAIVSVDDEHRIILFNAAAERLFRLPTEAALGRPIEHLIPERHREAHARHMRAFAGTGVTGRRMGALGEISGLRADGEEFPIEASISQAAVGGRTVLTVILRDITDRKRTEALLREHDERLRRALVAARVFTIEWEAATDTLVRSENCSAILGLPPETAGRDTSRGYLNRLHPEDREVYGRTIGALAPDNAEYEVVYRCVSDAGRTIWLEESGEADFDAQGAMLRRRGVAVDITRRREVEDREKQAVAASTAAQAAIDTVNAMGEGVALLDTRGVIRSVNRAFTMLTEHNREELEGRDIRRLLPTLFEEDSATIEKTMVRVNLKESKIDAGDALSILTRSGFPKWVIPTVSAIYENNHQSIGIVLTLRDITPLIQAQSRLRESERKYRELVENANSIILRITRAHRVTFFNEYAQTFFGFASDEILGRDIIGTITPPIDSRGRDLRKLTEAIAADPELHGSIDNENMCKDGRRVWIHWSNRAIRDARGDVREILCIGTDLTERKRLEQEADAYRLRLRELADRLVATEEQERRRVSAQIHDTVVQTLSLANIRMGGLHDAIRTAGLDREAATAAQARDLIAGGIAECRNLMADLSPPLLYELGLGPALTACAETLAKPHGMRIAVVDNSESQPLDTARRGLLFQAARELIMNAIKYAGPCDIHVRLSRDDRELTITVRDSGRGFDVEAANLFNAGAEGGFGLFNIRERLRNLGGRIDIQSSPGAGTTARLRVPLAQEAPPVAVARLSASA